MNQTAKWHRQKHGTVKDTQATMIPSALAISVADPDDY
jgi:hypothetical protein